MSKALAIAVQLVSDSTPAPVFRSPNKTDLLERGWDDFIPLLSLPFHLP